MGGGENGSGSVNGGFAQHKLEEDLAVLPPDTKVLVIGNNRTNLKLVGLEGVVKKAVGLGGWHWLVMSNGAEVKLQRNALTVIEAPANHEDGNEIEGDNMQWNALDFASDNAQSQKGRRTRTRIHRGSAKKALSESPSTDSQSKGSVSFGGTPKVDLSKLETTTLWRYWLHYNPTNEAPNLTREQLLDAVQRHFDSQEVDEFKVIKGFVKAAKRLKNAGD